MHNTFKAIAYAYPTSDNAKALGFYKDGCWHVEVRYEDIEGSGQSKTFLPHDAEGFATPDHPDLIALYREEQGTMCPMFARYGNPLALAAIAQENESARP